METKTNRYFLTSLAHYHPEHIIENSFFEKLKIDSDGDWVEERTGIRSRRSVLSPEQILSLRFEGARVSKMFLDGDVQTCSSMIQGAMPLLKSRDSGFNEDEIGLLTCGTSVPDHDIPANACKIANTLGISSYACDINSACSSFVTNLHWHRMWLDSNPETQGTMVANPERYSTRMNFNDRSSCILFGDGAVVGTLNRRREEGLELLDTMVWSDPSKSDLVVIPAYGTFWQNGGAVQKFAITKTMDGVKQILAKNNYSISDVNYIVGHQANLRMLRSSIQKLGLDDEHHLYNVDEFGNQGAAGAPAALSKGWDRLKSGDLIVMAVVGSGLTWGSALFRKV